MSKTVALKRVIRFASQMLNIQSADEATAELIAKDTQIAEMRKAINHAIQRYVVHSPELDAILTKYPAKETEAKK